MPEFDAFGREIGDDPLLSLRAATVEPVPAHAAPAEAPPAEAPPPAPAPSAAVFAAPEPFVAPPAARRPQFARPPRRRRLAPLLVLAAFIAGIAWAASVVVVTVQDEVGGVIDGLDGVVGLPGGSPPTGLEGASLIRRANLTDALATLRESGFGRPFTLRVAPDRVDATLVDTDGRMHYVQVGFDGELRELSSSPSTGQATTAFNRIDPAAPERLVRDGGRRAGVAAGRINYVVLNAGPPISWGAYFNGGKIVFGGARGRPRRVL